MEDIIEIHPILGRKPNKEFIHEYIGFGIHDSQCNVKIWDINENLHLIICTDLGKGTSVTNAAEQIATEIYQAHFKGVDKKNLIFAETYEDYKMESLDMWVLKWSGDIVVDIDWKHMAIIERNV